MEVSGKTRNLPENAYLKLGEGEKYVPVVPAEKIVPELTPYSLLWGLFFAFIFSGASAYLGLKIGQVFEEFGQAEESTDRPERHDRKGVGAQAHNDRE